MIHCCRFFSDTVFSDTAVGGDKKEATGVCSRSHSAGSRALFGVHPPQGADVTVSAAAQPFQRQRVAGEAAGSRADPGMSKYTKNYVLYALFLT